ncbi:MAG: polysaccharide biosynthesis protein [Candidatus Atribacteria bacterium]|nr:polysaccharide biosynthesis protein [Candidatus Atribacteria bacterium]
MEFKNKILLITGGTGSFGNAVLRRYLDTEIGEIRIFSRDEKKQDDMRQFYKNPKIKYYIGDVRDRNSIDYAMAGVDYVFHAAALKQVPSCEFFPAEAVRTNVLGCENVLDAALQHSVKKVIVLSTDKAVYPINAMGMSKALSEKVMVAKSRHLNSKGMVFCGTRYGNVMASRGSVIPLFVDQIKKSEAITITDPNMTRFMMTLDDAVELVIFAFKNGANGDIFVQKSPASTIADLAQALKELYKSDVPVKIIGTRHGEKLYETLVNREEMAKATELKNYYRIPADTRDLNYNKFVSEGESEVSSANEYTSHNTQRLNVDETKQLLLKLNFIREDVLKQESALTYEP